MQDYNSTDLPALASRQETHIVIARPGKCSFLKKIPIYSHLIQKFATKKGSGL